MNRMLQLLNRNAQPTTQPNNATQMMQLFAQFKNMMRGKNPEAIVNQLLAEGKMSPQQLEQLKQQAMSLRDFLK